jgi:cytochrome b561
MPIEPLLQISSNTALYSERLAISLGLACFVLAVLLIISCRSFLTLFRRITLKDLTKSKTYQAFYRPHSYYWWTFWILLILHVMVAVTHTELPTAGDPDANIHRLILGFGLTSFVSLLVVFLSCRSFTSLAGFFRNKSLLDNATYRSYYGHHGYQWWIFIAAVAVHFAVSYVHAGIWPVAA